MWPDNKVAAICLTWDVDDETPFYSQHIGSWINGLSELEQRSYGIRRGIPLIVNMLERHKIPGAFYIPAYNALNHPELIPFLQDKGYEIGCHGYMHEPLEKLTYTQEKEILKRSLNILEEQVGQKILGYRAPAWELNRWTPTLLKEFDFLYDSSLMGDIYPYRVITDQGSLLEIPIHWNLDDVEYWGHTKTTRHKSISSPATVLQIWSRELRGIYEAGGIFILTLHPHVSGRPGFMTVIDQFVSEAQNLPDLWWATPGQIALHLQNKSLSEHVLSPASPHLFGNRD